MLKAMMIVALACGASWAADAGEETREAGRAVADEARETRQDFERRAKKTMRQLRGEIDDLEDRSKAGGRKASAETRERMDALKGEYRDLEGRMRSARRSGGERWDEAREDFESRMRRLRRDAADLRDDLDDPD